MLSERYAEIRSKALKNEADERLLVEAARRDPARFAALKAIGPGV